MTKEQAFEILGLTKDQLLDNNKIQDMLTQHAANPLQVNSLIEAGAGAMIKVQNFQALIDKEYENNLAFDGHFRTDLQTYSMQAVIKNEGAKTVIQTASDGESPVPVQKMILISSNGQDSSSSGT